MKQVYFLLVLSLLSGSVLKAQISYTGCSAPIPGAYPYSLVSSGTTDDGGTIRNTYQNVAAPCALSSMCVFKIEWSIAASRWEILASSDAGASFPFLLYINTSASVPNPPDLSLGSWVGQGPCGGHAIALSGDVQSTLIDGLPIEFGAFKIKTEKNLPRLMWQTITENNNDYFTVERSLDLVNWEELGRVDGAGVSSVIKNYSFVDHTFSGDFSYYRIKQTDFNGVYEYSDLQMYNAPGEEVSIFPNPVKDYIRVTIPNQDIKRLELRSLNGAVLREESHEVEKMDLSGLAMGTYLIRIITESRTITKRIVKTKD